MLKTEASLRVTSWLLGGCTLSQTCFPMVTGILVYLKFILGEERYTSITSNSQEVSDSRKSPSQWIFPKMKEEKETL